VLRSVFDLDPAARSTQATRTGIRGVSYAVLPGYVELVAVLLGQDADGVGRPLYIRPDDVHGLGISRPSKSSCPAIGRVFRPGNGLGFGRTRSSGGPCGAFANLKATSRLERDLRVLLMLSPRLRPHEPEEPGGEFCERLREPFGVFGPLPLVFVFYLVNGPGRQGGGRRETPPRLPSRRGRPRP
jgi:hypothetical protein